MELESQMAENHHNCWELSLHEQQVLLTTEPHLQPIL